MVDCDGYVEPNKTIEVLEKHWYMYKKKALLYDKLHEYVYGEKEMPNDLMVIGEELLTKMGYYG